MRDKKIFHGRKLVISSMNLGVIILFLILLTACTTNNVESEQLRSDIEMLQKKYDALDAEKAVLQKEYETLEAENAELLTKIKEAEPWFQLSELEKETEEKHLAEEKAAKEELERQAAAKAAAEAEAKEKLGYDTGITYNQLSRTPDDYEGEKVKFSGKVIQVIEGSGETQLRVATKGNYENVVLVYYSSNIVSSRVLENDFITLYGISEGLYTYQSTMGGMITIPLIKVEKIDQ